MRERDASTRASARQPPSPADSRAPSRISRTFRSRTVEGRRIREAFIAPPGHTLISADYSQIELRIMAHLSGDESLLRAFAAGEGHPSRDCLRYFSAYDGRRHLAATKLHQGRQLRTDLRHERIRGSRRKLGIERSAAAQFIEKFSFAIPAWPSTCGARASSPTRRVMSRPSSAQALAFRTSTPGGGPRRQAAERARDQRADAGTAADLIKLAMIEVQSWLDRESAGATLVLQVHDELVLEAPLDQADRIRLSSHGACPASRSWNVPLGRRRWQRSQLGAGALDAIASFCIGPSRRFGGKAGRL